MPPSGATRSQLSLRHAKLLRKIGIIPIKTAMSQHLFGLARSILEMFPQVGSEGAPSTTMLAAEDVLNLLQDLLPSAKEMFTPDFFKQPMFVPASLYDTASYFGCQNVDEAFEESLHLCDISMCLSSSPIPRWLTLAFPHHYALPSSSPHPHRLPSHERRPFAHYEPIYRSHTLPRTLWQAISRAN